MELWKAIQRIGVHGLKFGCLKGQVCKGRRVTSNKWQIIEHYKHLSPAQQQHLDSCAAETTANLLEWWIYREFHKHVTIDAVPIYKKARKLFYNGELEGGLLLHHPAVALMEMGILPYGTKIKHVDFDIEDLVGALRYSPLATGHGITNGWLPENLNKENGCIDESDSDVGGGHATLLVGTNTHNGVNLFVHLNSWGKFPPMNGMFAMTPQYSIDNSWSNAVQLIMPKDISRWSEWEKLVIPNP